MRAVRKNRGPGRRVTPAGALRLAERLQRSGRLAEAEALCRQVLQGDPNNHAALHRLGLLAHRVGKLELALTLLERAVALDAATALYHGNLGEMQRQAGRLEAAIASGRRATALDGRNSEAFYNLGVALADAGCREEALVCYRRAVALNPDYGLAFNNLGATLEVLEDKEGAASAYARAIEIDARHAEAQNNLGAILSERGELEAAKRHFEAAIRARPHFIDPHFNLSTLKRYRSGEPHIVALEALARERHQLPEAARARLCFAVAKAREDLGEYARAFEAYAEGNRLTRTSIVYDERQGEETSAAIIRFFTRETFTARGGRGADSPLPVFILGMPRSGSSLIEQILASHPEVHGAGELHDLNDAIAAACNARSGGRYPQALADCRPEDFGALGAHYLEHLQGRAPAAARITDKMPANFHHIGMIRLMLPGARIIHARRDPLDTCLSNFTRHFSRTMEFAYDLEELGRYHRRYQRLMAHWRNVLPADVMLEIDYEAIVKDLEGESRRMIDFLGLSWDSACLTFHENLRPVKTASVAQVRQPIYRSSLGRWKKFEAELEPLRRALLEEAES